jgi:predicted permease
MTELLRDIRLALKSIRRERAFSATVLLTLAVVIGANVAIFSVIQAVLLEPLPYRDADELVTIYNRYPGAGVTRASNGSYDFLMRRERVDAFEEVALLDGSGSTVGDPGSTERVSTMRVTPSLFPLLGVNAAVGRTFTDDEMDEGNHYKVLLTDGYWRDAFNRSPDVVGRDLRIDGRAYQIIGVTPPDFRIVGSEEARFFVPIAFDEEDRSPDSWHSNNYEMIGRLRDGYTIEQARAQNDALNSALIDESTVPNARQLLEDAGYSTVVVPSKEDFVSEIRPTLFMLWAGVAFVLLIGCVNIANLMLARAQIRLGEVATRLALGAPRSRVARQLVTESLVMSAIGGALGVAAGLLGLRLLTGFGLERLPRGVEIGVNGAVVVFTVGLVVLTGLLFAAVPVVEVLRRDLSTVFRSEGRSTTASRGAVVLRNALVTGQVALAFVLLVGAGLMLMSFRAALSVEPGFDVSGLATAHLSLPSARYQDGDARRAFFDELLREAEGIPGLAAASITSQLPFSGNNSSSVIFPEGYVPRPGESILSPYSTYVGPNYFSTMGIEVVEGREFDWTDGPGQPQVIIIDEWLAGRFWPDESPLGHRMVVNVVPGMEVADANLFTIVGVVETIKHNDLTAPEGEHVGAYYFSWRQASPTSFNSVVLRARQGIGASVLMPPIRRMVTRLDPELPLFDVQTMEERIATSLADRRTPMTLLIVFAGVALFLAVIGIYGALAYSVTHRMREMGIRIALGSAPADIFKLILGHGIRVAGVGLLIGILASAALGSAISSMLFGVRPLDPLVMAGVAAVLGAAALLACALPAWNATRVDPVSALTPE